MQNNHEDYLKLWDDSNIISPNDVNIYSRKKVKIRCARGLHEPTEISVEGLHNRKTPLCKKCNSVAQFGIDLYGKRFFTEIWDWEKNKDLNPWNILKSSNTKVFLFCQNNREHGSQYVKCNSFYNSKRVPCSKCNVRGNSKPIKKESLGYLLPEAFLYWSDNNTIDPYEVTIKSHKVVKWKCGSNIHQDFDRVISESVRYNFRCPACVSLEKSSILQQKTVNYITQLGYSVLHEYECNLKPPSPTNYNNIILPYDNEISSLKLIIEVMGAQHYTVRSWHTSIAKRNHTTPEYELQQQQKRDEYKKQYALSNGYSYLALPYYDFDDDTYKIKIDNKIKEITNQKSVTTE